MRPANTTQPTDRPSRSSFSAPAAMTAIRHGTTINRFPRNPLDNTITSFVGPGKVPPKSRNIFSNTGATNTNSNSGTNTAATTVTRAIVFASALGAGVVGDAILVQIPG